MTSFQERKNAKYNDIYLYISHQVHNPNLTTQKIKHMKKRLFFVLAFFAVTMLSCLKDSTDYSIPENLVGTTWKYTYYRDVKVDYISLKFTSTTIVELRTKEFKADDRLDHTGNYTIEGNVITIVYDAETLTGVIKRTTIDLTNSKGTYLFRKE